MAEWKSIPELEVPGIKEANAGLGSAMQGIISIVGTATSILDVLSSFLVVKESPVIAAVRILLAEIQTIIDSLSQSAVHGLFLIPDSLEELVQNNMGGYGKFEQQFLRSLHDTEDPNRPQFGSSQTAGALVILLMESNPSSFIETSLRFFRFFNRTLNLRYPSPANVRIKPAGSLGLPEDQLINVFTEEGRELDRLRMEWQEPRLSNDIFLDIFARNKFYIEKSKSREGKIQLREETPPTKKSPLHKRKENEYSRDMEREALLDSDGEFIYYWEPVDPEDPFVEIGDLTDISQNRINFLAGSYSYIIQDVEPGSSNAYYYRVRSVPSDTELTTQEILIRDSMGTQKTETVYNLVLNAENIAKYCPPSSPVFGNIPDVDTSFDLPTALLQTYRAAYLLKFDEEYQPFQDQTALGPNLIKPKIRESLYYSLEDTATLSVADSPDPETGLVEFFEMPYWPEPLLLEEDPSLYDVTVERLRDSLVVSASSFDPFGGVDEFISPRLDLEQRKRLRLEMDKVIETKIKSLVPYLMSNEGLFQIFQDIYSNTQNDIETLLREGISEQDLLEITDLRSNVFSLLQLIEGGVSQGTPPNWESIQFVNDLFPFVGKASNKLMEFINSLNNVLQSSLDNVKNGIQGIQDRLEVLTSLLDVIDDLINILTAFESLSTLFNVLWIPPESGGNSHLISEFRTADNKPNQNANEVVGGIVLAFGGPGTEDLSGLVNAITFIFGD